MDIIPVPETGVGSAPAAFWTDIEYVANLFNTLFTNNLTLYIGVGWGTVDGIALGKNSLGESLAQQNYSYSYSQVRNALIAQGDSPAQQEAYATLPATAPAGAANVYLSEANAEALGLLSPSTQIVGYVGFSTTADFSYAANSTPAANAYDFISVAEHEITEVLGRVAFPQYPSETEPGLMDLFRYSASGLRDLTVAPPTGYYDAYFSIDNGVTDLGNFNTYAKDDLGDWDDSVGDDAFLAASYPGTLEPLSAQDLTLMNVLGYQMLVVVSSGQTQTVGAGQTFSATTVISSGTETVSSGGVAVGTVVYAGGVEIVNAGGVASSAVISAGGTEYVGGVDSGGTVFGLQEIAAGGFGSAETLANGGDQSIISGGYAYDVQVGPGSDQYIEAGAIVSDVGLQGFQEVDGGGTAGTVTVSANACETVAAGGFASQVTIDLGGSEYVESGATASGVSVGGFQEIDAGGRASNVTVANDACETVEAGGSAVGVVLDFGGFEYVESAATATGVTVMGYQEVDRGGLAGGVTVASGACETLASGGAADDVTVQHGGFQYVYGGAVASGTTIQGYQQVNASGLAISATVSSGSAETVTAGGSATALTVDQGGFSFVLAGGSVGAVTVAGYQEVNGFASGVAIAAGADEMVGAGGTADAVTVGAAGYQSVSAAAANGGSVRGYQEVDARGTATGFSVSAGGTQAVKSGGTAVNTTLAGGDTIVSAGGSATGVLTFAGAGGFLALQSGADFNAAISAFGIGDAIDLSAVAFSSAKLSLTDDTLTVTDGAHSVGLALLGQYMAAGFFTYNDGAGGTLLTYYPQTSAAAVTLVAGH
jgi:autotransporter passenger strand-loop-strand repeat protein